MIQLTEAGIPLLSGVISEGNSVDYSRYVPVSVFRQALPPELAAAVTAAAQPTPR